MTVAVGIMLAGTVALIQSNPNTSSMLNLSSMFSQRDYEHGKSTTQSSYSTSKGSLNHPTTTLKPYSSIPRFYKEQLVDHFDPSHHRKTWAQRYYAKRRYFRGPGHPIFLVIGGEGGNDYGMFYPFIERNLAAHFGAYVLHPEHRFYGISQPLGEHYNATIDELLNLLTPHQAMADMLQLANHYRRKLGCSMHRSSRDYCPLITTGGSYPGFLAAIMRLIYPDQVDMAYASSAPMKLYAQQVDQWGYFDIITQVADRVSPGCARATKKALTEVTDVLSATDDFKTLAYERLNVCPGSIPKYIDSGAYFAQELMQIIETSFADSNMVGNYPPSNNTWFAQLCHVFQNTSASDSLEMLTNFWTNLEIQDKSVDCFVMDFQMSEGDHATISSADWSGLGPGRDGRMWDFQCCTSLTPAMGFSHESMFPYRKWTRAWLEDHCLDRFGVVGNSLDMVDEWHFDDLVAAGASRIIFTNGGNDMWLAGSYTHNLSDSIIAVNMPSGAHHSEVYGLPNDEPDIKAGQVEITTLLGNWLHEIKHGKYH
jgi:GNAT superfamily N-acetyltransferase